MRYILHLSFLFFYLIILNEIIYLRNVYLKKSGLLGFYGITKDPKTKEFMMIIQFTDKGNLRSILSSDFKNVLWKDKIYSLYHSADDLRGLHKLGYFHKDFHSGNILQRSRKNGTYI